MSNALLLAGSESRFPALWAHWASWSPRKAPPLSAPSALLFTQWMRRPLPITDHYSGCSDPAERSLLSHVLSSREYSTLSPAWSSDTTCEHGSDISGVNSSRTWSSSSGAAGPAAVAQYQERTKAAPLPSYTFVPGSERLRRRMGFCKMEECTIDSIEMLYSGAVDKIKSHKSNLNLSKFNNTLNEPLNLITC